MSTISEEQKHLSPSDIEVTRFAVFSSNRLSDTTVLRFDADGSVYPGFEVYAW